MMKYLPMNIAENSAINKYKTKDKKTDRKKENFLHKRT